MQKKQYLILLVEDEAITAMAGKAKLEKYGYDVVIANSGREAIELFQEYKDIDLILMDIDLGKGIDGTEAAETILNIKDIPIVFHSSHTDTETVEKTEKITSYGYVVKSSQITVVDASIKMAFKLFYEKQKVRDQQQELAVAYEEMEAANEELEATNESLEKSHREIISREQDLHISREKYMALFEKMQDGVALHEMVYDENSNPIDYKFLDVNEAYEKHTSLKRSDILQKRVTEVLPGIENDPADWIGIFSKVAATGEPVNFENYAEPLDKWYSVVAYRPQIGQFAVIIHDITKNKKFEQELAKSENKYRSLFDNINVAAALHEVIVDDAGIPVDFTFLDANSAYEKMTHLKVADIIGKRGLEVIPNLEQKWIDVYGKVALTGEATTIAEHSEYLDKYWDVRVFSPKQNQFAVAFTDITERTLSEKALEKRIVTLTRPLGDVKNIEFTDLFNIDDIQKLQDEFAAATGVASIITDVNGVPITEPSNFSRDCNDIIRETEKGKINCFKSDAVLGKISSDGPRIQPCMSGGLWDAGAGISVGGHHIANWLIGQVRDETQTEKNIRRYAQEIDVDEATMVDAFHEVPAMTLQKFEGIAKVLYTLANQLSTIAFQNVQQARLITELKQAETESKKQLQQKEIILKEAHHRIKNNMASIENLLDLQCETITSDEAIYAIREAISRLHSMRLLYDKLLLTADYKTTSVKAYLDSLIDEIISLFPIKIAVKVEKKISDFNIHPKLLFPLGIIVNELLSNSMKYAFTECKNCSVYIELFQDANKVTLLIKDNGVGLPSGFDINSTNGFGLMLVKLLSEQLNGSFEMSNNYGTHCSLEFELE